MDVQTDHQIVQFGANQMMLFDNDSSNIIVTAIRDEDGWLVKAENHDDVRPDGPVEGEPPRRKVIEAMVAMALEVSPAEGYSTLVPHGLEDLP